MSYVVVKQTKSIGFALLLTMLFGPIGLFCSSVIGGLIMTFAPFMLVAYAFMVGSTESAEFVGTAFVFLLLTGWLICIIWAVAGVLNYNRRISQYAIPKTINPEQSYETAIHQKEQTIAWRKALLQIIVLGGVTLGAWEAYEVYLKSRSETLKENISWTVEHNVDLHPKPDIRSITIGHILPGASLQALEETRYFIKVEFQDAKGYLRKGYLRKSEIKRNSGY